MSKIAQQFVGNKVIIRAADSGVHHGVLHGVEGDSVHLKNSRRLWEWSTGGNGLSLSEVAICGIKQEESRISMQLPDLMVFGVCEIIPTHGIADATIEGAKVATPQ